MNSPLMASIMTVTSCLVSVNRWRVFVVALRKRLGRGGAACAEGDPDSAFSGAAGAGPAGDAQSVGGCSLS